MHLLPLHPHCADVSIVSQVAELLKQVLQGVPGVHVEGGPAVRVDEQRVELLALRKGPHGVFYAQSLSPPDSCEMESRLRSFKGYI